MAYGSGELGEAIRRLREARELCSDQMLRIEAGRAGIAASILHLRCIAIDADQIADRHEATAALKLQFEAVLRAVARIRSKDKGGAISLVAADLLAIADSVVRSCEVPQPS